MTRITRIEIIDENGRSYVNWEDDNDVSWQFQDNGRTLKVFVNKVKPKTGEEGALEALEKFQNNWLLGKKCPETKLEIKKLDSVESIKAEIKVLQSKLEFYEELEKQPKTLFDVIRNLGYSVDMCYEIVDAVEEFEKQKEREMIKRNLKTSLQEMVNGDVRPIDDVVKEAKEEQKWDVVRESVKWCEEHQNESVEDYLTPKTPKQVEKLQEKDWDIKVETDYRTGKARHKLKIVDKDGNDYKPTPQTAEELLKPNWEPTPQEPEENEWKVKNLQDKNWYVDTKTNLKPHWEPKPQNEKEVAEGLKEAFVKAQQTEKWKETQKKIDTPKESWMDKPIDELVDKLMENPPDCLKFQLGKTLEQIVTRWWCDTFSINEKWSVDECIDDLIDQVEIWMPREQSAEGSQDLYACIAVDAENDLLKKIKSKLRNKKDT